VRVERIAVNRCTAPEDGDNDGSKPQGEPVVPGGPESYTATLPVSEIVEFLSTSNFLVEASDSAGEFLCNYVMYTTLHHISAHQLPIRAGFIHAPPLRAEAVNLTKSKGMLLKHWIDFTERVISLLRTSTLV
jgi:pyroglutamyl-peptidase